VLTGAAAAAVLLLLGVGASLLLQAHAKERVRALASDAIAMELNIRGRVTLGVLPHLHVTMDDVELRNRGAEIGTAQHVAVNVELLPLLRKEVRVSSLALDHVTLLIERLGEDKYNIDRAGAESHATATPLIGRLSLSDATLRYVDKQSARGFDARVCSVTVHGLAVGDAPGAWRRSSFAAEISCEEIKAKSLPMSDVKLTMKAQGGVLEIAPLTMRVLDGQGTGTVHCDCAKPVPVLHVQYSLAKFQLAEFFKALTPGKVGSGSLDFTTELSMSGESPDQLIRSAKGKASLRGRDLTLGIGDIDQAFSRYDKTQNFNLVDVGAVLLAGPAGLVVTKGYDYASAFKDTGGTSQVRLLVSEWNIEGGVAQATDAAMATKENRLALKGGLDFGNGRFKDMTVALLDPQGCARVEQQIRGTFDHPEIQQPNVLVSLSSPVRRLLHKTAKALGDKCDIFYAGSVPQPG